MMNATTSSKQPRSQITPLKVEVLHHEDDCTFASCGDVFMVIWHHNTTLETIERLRHKFAWFASGPRKQAVLLTIVEPNAPLPESKTREALAQFMHDNGARISASAVVFEGDGFRAAAVRSVVVGLSLLARQPFPHKVFAEVEVAAAWMLTTVRDGAIAPAVLLPAIARVRASHPAGVIRN